MMNTITTKEAAKLVRRELGQRARQLELVVLENESGTIQIEATTADLEDFERLGNPPIDSDVIPDDQMTSLLEYLESEQLLDASLPNLAVR